MAASSSSAQAGTGAADSPNPANPAFPASDAAGQTVAAMAQADTISPDEIALYDRQIRLWGVQAQEKIRTANILLVSIRALANEVAKNLVLAGIGSITLADHHTVTEEDLGAQFFLTEADVGKNRAEAAAPQIRKLNPRVRVHVVQSDVCSQPDMNFYTAYDIIIATDLDFMSFTALNAGARLSNKPFYAGATHGLYGYIFADLGLGHDFVVEREKSNRPTRIGAETATRSVVATTTKKENGKMIEMVTKKEMYTPLLLVNTSPLPPDMQNPRKLRKVHPLLTGVRALWDWQRNSPANMHPAGPENWARFTQIASDKHKELSLPSDTLRSGFLRSFLQNLGSEVAPVAAFLGGQLAQDAINVLGKREQPIQNLMLFDGEDSSGPVYSLHPIFPDSTLPPGGMAGVQQQPVDAAPPISVD